MPNPEKPFPKPASPTAVGPAPQRPQTLKRRISSSFNTFLAALPMRKTTPQASSNLRSSTALGEGVVVRRIIAGANPQAIQQLPVIRVQVPSLSEPSQRCPYDSSKYHSFPSVERSRCNFCGMRPPKSPSSEPCNECRSKSALSHVKSAFQRKPNLKIRKSATVRSPSRPQHSPSSEEGPRIVPPEIAARRIGNPPRRAALPVPRPGAVNNSMHPPPDQRVSLSLPPEHKTTGVSTDVPRQRRSALEQDDVRPISPKLHYHRGLPNSKDYPYVLQNEVSQHLDAIRAGEPSPLIDFARATRLRKSSSQTTDFSETVFYGQRFSAAFTDTLEQCRSLQPRSNLVVEGYLETGGHVVIERPRPEQQASIDAQLYGNNLYPRHSREQLQRHSRASRRSANNRHHSGRTNLGTESSTKDQGPNFQEGPANDGTPRLRGGSGGEENTYASGCGLMLKQLLLTCHRPGCGYNTDSGSDDNMPPARTPNPVEVARALRRAHGTSRLPKGISRGDGYQGTPRTGRPASGSADVASVPLSRTASFAATHRQRRSVLSYLPFFGPTSTLSCSTIASVNGPSSSMNVVLQPVILPPLVGLRGGAGSPSALRDHERLPLTLFWLAGGRGKPITTASWKSQKPKKRMGGLLGMALHGLDAATDYGTRKGTGYSGTGTEVLRNMPVFPEARKHATKEKAESLKSNITRSSRSSSSSKSSTKSHSSQSSKSNTSAAAGSEAQRQAPLGSVPEEAAAAPAIDPLTADAAVAEDPPIEVPAEDSLPPDDLQRDAAGAAPKGEASTPNGNENVEQAAAEGDGGANR